MARRSSIGHKMATVGIGVLFLCVILDKFLMPWTPPWFDVAAIVAGLILIVIATATSPRKAGSGDDRKGSA